MECAEKFWIFDPWFSRTWKVLENKKAQLWLG